MAFIVTLPLRRCAGHHEEHSRDDLARRWLGIVETGRDAQQASVEWAEGTVVIDFRVEQEDSVYPMVPAGADLLSVHGCWFTVLVHGSRPPDSNPERRTRERRGIRVRETSAWAGPLDRGRSVTRLGGSLLSMRSPRA